MAAEPSYSFKQFNYGLRPSKHVERKAMVEVLLRLAKVGYMINEYTYLGFGSPYYIDFVLFHKFLFIDDMICIEWGDIPKRMKFNKPFRCIKLKMGALLNHIPSLSTRKKYLVWLDYDRPLDPEMLQDIDGVLNRLAPESVFIVTIDAGAKLPKTDFDLDVLTKKQREKKIIEVYKEWFGAYLGEKLTVDSLDPNFVPGLFYRIVMERIRQTLVTKDGLKFHQIFNYLYADGCPMLTVGGIIGNEASAVNLRQKKIHEWKYVRTDDDFLEIVLPYLTIREKQWIDSVLKPSLSYDKLIFELDEELLEGYRQFYKEYPTFAEAML